MEADTCTASWTEEFRIGILANIALSCLILRREGDKMLMQIETFDAALVTPGTPYFLRFDDDPIDTLQGAHFNLFNNAWYDFSAR